MRIKKFLFFYFLSLFFVIFLLLWWNYLKETRSEKSNFSILLNAQKKSKYISYRTRFFEFKNFIEKSILDVSNNIEQKNFSLTKEIFGGVVPHHIPVAVPLIAEFYVKLKKIKDFKTFIILAPNHIDYGSSDIITSDANFETPFGVIKTNSELIKKIKNSGFVLVDNTPFEFEHSIHSQIIFIKKIFPSSNIVPIIFKSSTDIKQAKKFGEHLSKIVDKDTFVVASVDFSHYLTEKRSKAIDLLSIDVMASLNSNASGLLDTDSNQAIVSLLEYLKSKDANYFFDIKLKNTKDFTSNWDNTTGYVTGYFGKMEEKETSLIFVGDIMLSRTIGKIMEEKLDWTYPFLKIKDFLKNADITFGNLESPISNRGRRIGSKYSFRARPEVIKGLLFSGIDIVNIANNHILDYGKVAIEDTMKLLKENNIKITGGGSNYSEAHNTTIFSINGIKIGFLGYTNLIPKYISYESSSPNIAYFDENIAIEDIKKAKEKVDFLIVSLHWGEEYKTEPSFYQKKTARLLIDAGADLIIGHHPHVVQPVEEYKGRYIIYSLGNFIFDQNFSEKTKEGLVVKVKIKNKKITKLEKIKIRFTNTFQPFIAN